MAIGNDDRQWQQAMQMKMAIGKDNSNTGDEPQQSKAVQDTWRWSIGRIFAAVLLGTSCFTALRQLGKYFEGQDGLPSLRVGVATAVLLCGKDLFNCTSHYYLFHVLGLVKDGAALPKYHFLIFSTVVVGMWCGTCLTSISASFKEPERKRLFEFGALWFCLWEFCARHSSPWVVFRKTVSWKRWISNHCHLGAICS